ncbi:MAG: hypothetical protein OXQ93_16440 [Gemmatimonadota bacterium]|nr:hypothetical protein [Gemmatimonadota bacterium]
MPRKTKQVSFRLYPSDYEQIKGAAILRQISVTDWCRRVLIEAARREILIASGVDLDRLTAPYFGAGAAAMSGDSRSRDG